jgi:LPS export ABC transporter protein LptC
MKRKLKIRLYQIGLFLMGTIIVYYTYYSKSDQKNKIITESIKKNIISEDGNPTNNKMNNVFFNIKYSGIDLSGNRYILTAKEANNKIENDELINMKGVKAVFYFKDNSTLVVTSDTGKYNNKTLDMKFTNNVFMSYEDNSLKAKSAEYSNSGGFLKISKSVKISSDMGELRADRLYFDLEKQKLDISSFNNDNVKANVSIDEKRF